MKSRKIVFLLLLVVLLLGVGYAAITGVTLKVNGSTATITPNESDFDVVFDEQSTFTQTGDGSATFTRTDGHNVTFVLDGFTKKGDKAVITFPFKNMSETLKAQMADAVLTNSNPEYFTVTATSLASVKLNEKDETGSSANLVITVEAIKTPVDEAKTTTITATIDASAQNS